MEMLRITPIFQKTSQLVKTTVLQKGRKQGLRVGTGPPHVSTKCFGSIFPAVSRGMGSIPRAPAETQKAAGDRSPGCGKES